jgi:type IV fimbrial biogenesis protein FimT
LFEMVIALGLLAVLVTLALPAFASLMSRHRLKAAAEHLAVDLAELRFEATQRGVPLHLSFAAGENWCYSLASASGCDCRVVQQCQLKTVHAKQHPGVRLVQGQDVAFEPMQHGRIGGGEALLQGSDGARLQVGLTPLGRPKVCAPAAPVPGYSAC